MKGDKIMGVRETQRRRDLIHKYLKKSDGKISDVYRKVNNDIIKHKGVPNYLKDENHD